MSQNRGYRRDGGRQSYGNYGGGRNSHGGGGGGGGVNPWEGGMVPGRSGGGGGGLSNLLPQNNLLSIEAQLSLASNLLSSFLKPQQPQVPSLLSLGTGVGPVGGGGGFRSQSNFRGDRFNDLNRRKRMDGRQGNRKIGNQNRNSFGKSRNIPSPRKGDKKEGKDSKDKDDEDDTGKDDEKNIKKDEDDESDSEQKKRDWKDEKKGKPKGEVSGEEDDDDEDEDDDSKGKDGQTTRYAGIPKRLFNCHVCNKHMWDDRSFVNHINGRTHHLMMEKLEESYRVRAELMRHDMKVAEQQRQIELERMKRQGRGGNIGPEQYCTMCDLQFYGNLSVHRKSNRHRQLKRLLHPHCPDCSKEFPTRIEWDHHRLTPQHLRVLAAAGKSNKSANDEFDESRAADSDDILDDLEVGTGDSEEEDHDKTEKPTEENGEEIESGDKAEETKASSPEKDTIMVGKYKVQKYNPELVIGQALLKKVSGHTCRACQRFFLTEDDAVTHCRTLSHYNNYVELVKAKAKAKEEKEKIEKLEAEKKDQETDEKKGKRGIEDEDSENDTAKKRKVTDDEDDNEENQHEGEENDAEKDDSSINVQSGEDKYDPLEADAEEEEKAMKDVESVEENGEAVETSTEKEEPDEVIEQPKGKSPKRTRGAAAAHDKPTPAKSASKRRK